jgi:hypothetical protein
VHLVSRCEDGQTTARFLFFVFLFRSAPKLDSGSLEDAIELNVTPNLADVVSVLGFEFQARVIGFAKAHYFDHPVACHIGHLCNRNSAANQESESEAHISP